MIQYLYYHTGKEYISKLSLGRNEEDYSDREKLFEKIRKATEGNTFTYATLSNNEVCFMQSTKSANGLFTKGLIGGDRSIVNAPAKYIEKFEKSPLSDYLNKDTLPEVDLPVLGRLQDSPELARDLHHIFPKLVDILLFGDKDKKIIILEESHLKAINYVKVLSMLLPLSYIKKVGFSIGAPNIPDEDLSIIKNNGKTESASIRIWLPDIKDYDYKALSSYYYVFDTDKHQDNYAQELSATAKLLEEINLCDQTQINKFLQYIESAFDAFGNFNIDTLKRNAKLFLFEVKKDVNSAKEILDMGFEGGEKQKLLFLQASQILLKPENVQYLSEQDKKIILLGYKKNNYIAQGVESLLFDFLSSTYKSIDSSEKELFSEMIFNDKTGERLNVFLKKSLRGDFKARVDAFDFSCNIIDVALKRSGNDLNLIKDLIKIVIVFFDIGECFRIIPTSQITSGEAFFDCIPKLESERLRQVMTAILLSSAYTENIPEDHCETRLRGLKKALTNISKKPIEQFEFILSVRNAILDISDLIPELNIENQLDFLFNIKYGEMFVAEFISGLSIEDALDADGLVKSRTSQRLYYESMATAIRTKLFDINFVKKNVKPGNQITIRYTEFFETLPNDKRDEAVEVESYLFELKHETEINEEFAKYRYDFACECYNTLSDENKKQVQGNEGQVMKYEETPAMSEKLRIVESTIRVFGTIKEHKPTGVLPYRGVFLWAFAFSILSILILSLPAIIFPASLGTLDFEHIFDKFIYYFNPFLLVIPIYVFLVELIGYFGFKRGNRLKRANIATILCGIIPVVIFTLSCIFFYYIRIDLPFNL